MPTRSTSGGAVPRSNPVKSACVSAAHISRALSGRKLKKTTPSPASRAKPGSVGHDRGQDELVGLASARTIPRTAAAALGAARPIAMDESVVGQLHPLPALVAVHGVVAAGHGGYASRDPRSSRNSSSSPHILDTGRGRRVPAVHEGVDVDALQPLPPGQLRRALSGAPAPNARPRRTAGPSDGATRRARRCARSRRRGRGWQRTTRRRRPG